MPHWVNAIGTAIAFVVFLGAAVIYLRGSRDKGTIDILNRHSAAQDIDIADLNRQLVQVRQQLDTANSKIGALEREKASLAAERPSRERLTELHDLLTAFVSESKQSDAETRALLMAIAQLIEPKEQA